MDPSIDVDWPIRLAAFTTLRQLVQVHGPVLAWATIEQGFEYREQRVRFANQSKGIFRPAGMRDAALSLKTTVPRRGAPKYEDIATDEAFQYAFQRQGPDYHDNRLLIRALQLRTPLIYFYGVEPGVYRPLWPVYATPHADERSVLLAVEPEGVLLEPGAHVADPVARAIVRRYATIEAKKRLHQDVFRGVVLHAYANRCSICRLPRRELLDAAHIIPDRDVRGIPHVSNGLALCKLHHGAYDANLLGIRGDYTIEISPRLMVDRDGPTLEQGLKAFDRQSVHLPQRASDHPSAEHLELRYERFKQAG